MLEIGWGYSLVHQADLRHQGVDFFASTVAIAIEVASTVAIAIAIPSTVTIAINVVPIKAMEVVHHVFLLLPPHPFIF